LPPTDEQRLGQEPLVALGAARIGATRLIDNLEC
jgi:pantoate--beta-alanine ligase